MSIPATPRFGSVNPAWFAIAVKALMQLAHARDMCPSGELAGSIGSHAVFLRRILAPMVRAGFVEAREGRVGGYRLARSPAEISLADVYRALLSSPYEDAIPLEAARGPAIPPAPSGIFTQVVAEVDAAVLEVLARHPLAELVAAMDATPPNCT
jgi:Rrf2 family transcriptional repressor of oqxAB